MPHLPFFLASFVWNYGLGMTWLVVPLYAVEQGLPAAQIGVLFSLPAIAQVLINLVGGACVDRFGGRRVMLAACLMLAAAAPAFIAADGFWTLLAGQGVLVVSRAMFWPANWALAAELPGERGRQLGRLNAASNTGQILGNGSCGFVLVAFGFTASFLVMAAMGIASFLFALRSCERPRAASGDGTGLFAGYMTLLRMRVMAYGVLCAYMAALPFSLSMSFYPIALADFGYGEDASGILMALRAVGGIVASLLVARFVATGPASRWPVAGAALVAFAVGLVPLLPHWTTLALLLFAAGFGSGIMTVYFQVTMAEVAEASMRGSALALGGLGWGLSHFTTPLMIGFLAGRFDLATGFFALGLVAFGVTLGLAGARRWAFHGTRLAAR